MKSIIIIQLDSSGRDADTIADAVIERAIGFEKAGKVAMRATAGAPPDDIMQAVKLLPWPEVEKA